MYGIESNGTFNYSLGYYPWLKINYSLLFLNSCKNIRSLLVTQNLSSFVMLLLKYDKWVKWVTKMEHKIKLYVKAQNSLTET